MTRPLFHRTIEPLTRPAATRRPVKFILAVEGAETEKSYFDLFESSRVDLVILPTQDGRSSPRSVEERLIAYCRQREKDLCEGLDELWLVIDVDHHEKHGHLSRIAASAERYRYRLAVSRPCFESWLLLHLSDELDASCPRTAQQALGAALGRAWRKKKNRIRPTEAGHFLGGLSCAVDRARRRREAEVAPLQPWPQTPGSDVYRLIEALATHGVVTLAGA